MNSRSRIIKVQHSGPLCSWRNEQIYFISLWGHPRIVDIHTDFLKSSMKTSTCLHTERTGDIYFMKKWCKREWVPHLWEVTWPTPRCWDMETWASTFIGAITSQKSQSSPITHWILLLSNSCVEALTPKCDCIWRQAFKEVIKVNEIISVGP